MTTHTTNINSSSNPYNFGKCAVKDDVSRLLPELMEADVIAFAYNSPEMIHRVFDSFEGFAYCFDNIRNKGRIYGLSADEKGEIISTLAYNEAYKIGKLF